MTKRISGRAVIVLLASALALVTPAFADGGKAKDGIYEATTLLPGRTGSVYFRVSISPVIFYLGTVNRKYHVLLIRVKNDGREALLLSKEHDTIELHYSDGLDVNGLIDLRTVDPQTWDSLEPEIRTAVAYPPIVQAGEEEGIYVFAPVEAVVLPRKKHEIPRRISFAIKSISHPVELSAPVAKN